MDRSTIRPGDKLLVTTDHRDNNDDSAAPATQHTAGDIVTARVYAGGFDSHGLGPCASEDSAHSVAINHPSTPIGYADARYLTPAPLVPLDGPILGRRVRAYRASTHPNIATPDELTAGTVGVVRDDDRILDGSVLIDFDLWAHVDDLVFDDLVFDDGDTPAVPDEPQTVASSGITGDDLIGRRVRSWRASTHPGLVSADGMPAGVFGTVTEVVPHGTPDTVTFDVDDASPNPRPYAQIVAHTSDLVFDDVDPLADWERELLDGGAGDHAPYPFDAHDNCVDCGTANPDPRDDEDDKDGTTYTLTPYGRALVNGGIPVDAVRAAADLLGGPGRDLDVDAVLRLASVLDVA